VTLRRVGDAWIADTARVLGRVTLGRDVSVWYGTVIRGDVAAIEVGDATNVQDLTVLHCDTDEPLVIGPNVSIGHAAVVHCASVGEGTLIGIGARVLAGARIGKGCLVAAGALVPPGLVVPDGMVVMGLPGRIVRKVSAKERAYLAEVPPGYAALAKRHAAGLTGVAPPSLRLPAHAGSALDAEVARAKPPRARRR
jgi:carbonic anhydrase/acetyltransferase-like protein (isoleucine patch superfamily)